MAKQDASLLTTGQAAQLCEVTADTILKWIRKGRLRAARTAGGHYRVAPEDLESLIPPNRRDKLLAVSSDHASQPLHCWSYLGDQGAVREECRECVVYQVRAARCFRMAQMQAEVGHAKQFCRSSCEDCEYYRRVRGLPTNVLIVTPDEPFLEQLSATDNPALVACFASSAYEASAMIEGFQAAFVVLDAELLAMDKGLLGSLAQDPRLPGVKLVVAAKEDETDEWSKDIRTNTLFAVIKKPFDLRTVATVVGKFPVERPGMSTGTG